jgi:hypothetical protein
MSFRRSIRPAATVATDPAVSQSQPTTMPTALDSKIPIRIRVAVDRQVEKFVVGGVAARHDPLDYRDQLGGGHQLLQPGPRVGIDQRVKVRAGDHLE